MSRADTSESDSRERAFDAMVAEWEQVAVSTQATEDRDSTTSDAILRAGLDLSGLEQRQSLVAEWERDFAATFADEMELRRSGKWVRGRDDFLGVLGLQRYELSHSKIITWLLDPSAPHGLGTRVLSGVLRRAFGDEIHDAVSTTLNDANPEFEIDNIDILVKAPGLTLIIENKVDACEGEAQCDRYYERFRREPGACFLFLTPKGRSPRSATGSAQEAFKALGYGDLLMIIRAALEATASDAGVARGRHIAQDYCHTIEKEFR
jgi:PD-(D/E)XK nuclease superfamily